MRLFLLPLVSAIALAPMLAIADSSNAQPYRCQRVSFGTGASGEQVSANACSVSRVSDQSANFTYYLDRERIFAQAHCVNDYYWYTFDDRVNPNGKRVYPQSSATRRLLNYVCTQAGFRYPG